MNKILIELKLRHIKELETMKQKALEEAFAGQGAEMAEEFAKIDAQLRADVEELRIASENKKEQYKEQAKKAIEIHVAGEFNACINEEKQALAKLGYAEEE